MRLDDVLASLDRILSGVSVRYAIVGAYAVASWGDVRGTRDLDLLVEPRDLERLVAALERSGQSAELRRGDADDPIGAVIRLMVVGGAIGYPVDILAGIKGVPAGILERARPVQLANLVVPIASPEDMTLLKLRAGRRGISRTRGGIHPFTEAVGLDIAGGRVRAVETNRGTISAGTVVNATAGFCSTVARLARLRLPVVTHPLQAFVTEPIAPLLDKVIVSATLHVYVSQTDRGELVAGSEIDPYSSYSYRSTLPFLDHTAASLVELFPCLRRARVLRQWAGICDMTPDYSPIMGRVPGLDGFVLDVGWGTYGFKAGPVSGVRIAELIETGRTPAVLEPFSITRFWEERLVGEKAAAAVSH